MLRDLPVFSKVLVISCAIFGQPATSETIEVKIGRENTNAVSTNYAGSSISSLQAEATYAKSIGGRWSFYGQYQINAANTLSAGIAGFIYDSDDLLIKGGAIGNDGTAEITRTPVWLLRSSFGFGLFKYIDLLESNDASLGNRNKVPIQADLYGLKLSTSIVRTVSDVWGFSFGATYSVASASNFGVSSAVLSFGSFYRTHY